MRECIIRTQRRTHAARRPAKTAGFVPQQEAPPTPAFASIVTQERPAKQV